MAIIAKNVKSRRITTKRRVRFSVGVRPYLVHTVGNISLPILARAAEYSTERRAQRVNWCPGSKLKGSIPAAFVNILSSYKIVLSVCSVSSSIGVVSRASAVSGLNISIRSWPSLSLSEG